MPSFAELLRNEWQTVVVAGLMCVSTVLCIIGNVLKAFTYTSTGTTVNLYLWRGTACTAGGGCAHFSHSDIGSGSCDFRDQYRAAQAFGIITTIASGISALMMFAFVLFRVPRVKLSLYGTLLGGMLMTLNIIAFIVFVTVKNLDCLSGFAEISYGPAAFMYLGALVLSLLTIAWSILAVGGSVALQRGAAQAPSPIAPVAMAAVREPSVPEETRPPQPSVERVLPFPSQPVASPATNRASPTLAAPSSSGGRPCPEGDDWVFDESSALSWSESKKLFFDPSSCQFYDPGSELWYDPETSRWHRIDQ